MASLLAMQLSIFPSILTILPWPSSLVFALLAAVNSSKHNRLSNGLYIRNVSQADAGEYTCRAMRITPTFSDSDQITILLRIQRKCHCPTPSIHSFCPCSAGCTHSIIFNREFILHPTCWQLHLATVPLFLVSWVNTGQHNLFADGSLKLFKSLQFFPLGKWACFVGFNEIFSC